MASVSYPYSHLASLLIYKRVTLWSQRTSGSISHSVVIYNNKPIFPKDVSIEDREEMRDP